jgi:hypothetical protein
MTREQAITELNTFKIGAKSELGETALDMAIKALEQEHCEDAISRKAVLDTLDNMDSVLDEDRTVETYKELLVACYKDLPSVTSVYKKEWIPVTERLPKDRREVLVTAYWHETYQVMMGSYFGDELWWCVPFNNSGEHMQKLKPKAWMPLPEKYKEESEDKE